MGNFFRMINIRWSREEIAGWGSLRKTAYLLLPLLFYFLVHDGAEILLWAGLDGIMTSGNKSLTSFLTDNAYTVNGLINGFAILAGVAAIWRAIRGEIRGRGEEETCSLKQGSVVSGKEGSAVSGDEGYKETETGVNPARSGMESVVTRYMVLGALAFLTALSLNLLFSLLGLTGSSQGYAQTARAQYGVNFVVGLFLYGILSPAAEEAVFRGLIYNRMKRCFGYVIALVVSSLFFGCYHGNVVQALYGTVLGLLIAWAYEKYGSFAAPVLFHGVANVSIYAMTYYNSLGAMSREVSIGVIVVSLLGAGVCLGYIKRCHRI